MQTSIEGLLFLALVIAAPFLYQFIGSRLDRLRYPPPGSIVRTPTAAIHLHASGVGGPTILLEAGIASSSVSWTGLQLALQKHFRVISYDRAGLGWSSQSSAPRTPRAMLEELHSALEAAREPGPFLLVGHSFGGLLVRLYADRYREQVVGLLLLDPALVCEWARPDPARRRMLLRGIALSRRGAWLARTGFVRFSLQLLIGGARALPKLLARVSSGNGSSVAERLVGEVRKLPPELWPAVRAHWCRPSSFSAMAEYLESLPGVATAVSETTASLPTRVISSGKSTPEQLKEHAACGTHTMAEASGHWIHLDQPSLVVQTVLDMVGDTVS